MMRLSIAPAIINLGMAAAVTIIMEVIRPKPVIPDNLARILRRILILVIQWSRIFQSLKCSLTSQAIPGWAAGNNYYNDFLKSMYHCLCLLSFGMMEGIVYHGSLVTVVAVRGVSVNATRPQRYENTHLH